ncbi:MAG: Gx transporter family protein [Clostridia bacterium]
MSMPLSADDPASAAANPASVAGSPVTPIGSTADPVSHGDRVRRLTAFLAALAFFLSTVEYMLPRPVPFMRLGLANLPLLFAVDLLPFGPYLVLALVKVIGMSLLTGSLFSYIALFSLAGTLASALVMRILRKIIGPLYLSYLGLCVAGAMASNLVQVALARVFVFGPSARLMLPAFLGLGLVSGIALGLFAQAFAARSSWYTKVMDEMHDKS